MCSYQTPKPRERILEKASALFYAEGLRAVGVDRIIDEANVAKASFYQHFPSKDDLIVAYLEQRDQAWRDWLTTEVENIASSASARPLAIFDALARRFSQKDFRGCAFGNSISEITNPDHPARKVGEAHKLKVKSYIAGLLHEAGYSQIDEIASAFLLLIDGATITTVRERTLESIQQAKLIATTLLTHYAQSTFKED